MNSLFAELKRRNVYKVAVGYAVVGWLAIQISSTVLPTFHAPEWVLQTLVVVVVIGLPIALVIAWAFEMTPEGMKRTENVAPDEKIPQWSRRKFATFIAAVALVAAALLTFQVLRSRTAPAAPASAKSIAVLPFASLSEDKANAYFADGIQDEILTRLSKIAQLKVISRTSTQQYQSKPGNLSEIARQLGVAHILEGSVQKSNDSVRVNVQLIKADGDSHLWAETYDRRLTDIFAVESEVAQRIAGSLEAQLSGREQSQVADIPTKNPQAYDAYLRGLALLNQQGIQPIEDAIKYLQSATALDPQYAQAWAQLGIAEAQKSGYERTPAQIDRARAAAETAVRLQPESSETHESLATYYYYCLRDLDRALAELERARTYSPNDAAVIFYTGLIKRRQGKLDESIELQRKASTLDPRNPDIWGNLSGTYRGRRDFKTSLEMIDRALAISPDELDVLGFKAEIYMAQGELDSADEVLRGRKLQPGNEAFYQRISALVSRRRFDDALAAFAETEDAAGTLPPLLVARRRVLHGYVYALAGREGEARPLLERARGELLALREQGNASNDIDVGLAIAAGFLGDRALLDRASDALLSRTADHWQYGLSQQIVAGAYAFTGDAGRALPLIESALTAECDSALTAAQLRQDPIWDRLRNDPRFVKLAAESR
jgi:TolB-like protein